MEIRKKIFKERVELHQIFREHDREGVGIINSIAFTYLLNEFLGVPEDKIVSLVKLLDPSNRNLISYMDFIRLIHDPNSMEQMPLFKLGDQTRNEFIEKQREQSRFVHTDAVPTGRIPGDFEDAGMRIMGGGPDRDDRSEKKATKSVGIPGL